MKTENIIIDAVFTWVDGSDQKFKEKLSNYISKEEAKNNEVRALGQIHEIEYAVKSIRKYAKFVRNIFIVTADQVPDFLKDKEQASIKYPNVFVVSHNVIFEGYHQYLPTFSCLPIESLLYRIPKLSEHFLYLNDDFFLLREATINDFFINGNPVIRGEWTSFYEDIWYKKIQKSYHNFLGKKEQEQRYGFKKAQQTIARILGFKRYVRIDHTVAAFRKSTFNDFYKENPELLDRNIKHRFRHFEQYTHQSLANHLEIKNKTFVLKNDYQLVYFQNYKKPFIWLKYKLNRASSDKNKLFLCMQGLNLCPDEKLVYIKNWLSQKYD